MLQLVRAAWHLLVPAWFVEETDPYDGPLVGAHVGLFTAWPGSYSPTRVIGDLTEAGYTDYARQPAVFGTPYTGSDGWVSVPVGELEWRPTDAVTPNTVIGLFLASAITAGVLLGVEAFAAPVALQTALDFLKTVTEVRVNPEQVFGESSLIH
jgi:hypothetical protein